MTSGHNLLLSQEQDARDAVFLRIKACVLADTPRSGKRIKPGTLADRLGLSTTPVREGLQRLAAHRLVDAVPGLGFFHHVPGRRELFDLHRLNRDLLCAAIDDNDSRAVPYGQDEAMRFPDDVADDLGLLSAQIFKAIAQRSRNRELQSMIDNLNDRLLVRRREEAAVFPGTVQDLRQLYDLNVDRNTDQLRQSIRDFHARRLIHIVRGQPP